MPTEPPKIIYGSWNPNPDKISDPKMWKRYQEMISKLHTHRKPLTSKSTGA